MSMSKDALPSTLLRLCVLCSTSLHTIETAQTQTVDREATKQDGRALSEKIYSDVLILSGQVRKEAIGLSLALRPEGSQDDAEPFSGLDEKSIDAALHMLQSLATEAVPKLVFLATLALKNERVHDTTDAVANDPAVQEAREMGAQIILGEDAIGPLVVKASVGTLFASEIRRFIVDLVETVGMLCQSFMDERTRSVLARAREKRGEGDAPNFVPHTRAESLALTKRLWTLCDGAEGDKTNTPAYISRLPRNNYEALVKSARQNELVLRDGMTELQESLEDNNEEKEENIEEPQDDIENMWGQNVKFTEEEKQSVRGVLDLVQSGIALVKEAVVSLNGSRHVDLDHVAELIEGLTASQDDLIAAVLYEDETGEGLADVAQAYVDTCEALHECIETPPDNKMKAIESAWKSLSL